MAQSLVKDLIPLADSTKRRRPRIAKDHREGLSADQAGTFQRWEGPASAIGGVEDRLHAPFALSEDHPPSPIVEGVERGSSTWMKSDGPGDRDFRWQAGYGASSVNRSNPGAVSVLSPAQGVALGWSVTAPSGRGTGRATGAG